MVAGQIRTLLLSVLAATTLHGQSVRGLVQAGGAPIPHAVINLYRLQDSSSIGSTISQADGHFSMLVGGGSPVRVQVHAIGYQPHDVTLTPSYSIDGAPTAVMLEPNILARPDIDSQGRRNQCRRPLSGRPAIANLFQIIEITGEALRRTLARRDLRFESIWQQRQSRSADRDEPFVADSQGQRPLAVWPVTVPHPDVVFSDGFGRLKSDTEGGGRWYFGPDLELLTIERFIATHCFWIDNDNELTGDTTIMLRFEPHQRGEVVDIEGFLLLDTRNATVTLLEYHHVNVAMWIPRRSAGGRIAIGTDSTGLWYPSSWSTWSPVESQGGRVIGPPARDGLVARSSLSFPRITGHREERGSVVGVVPLPPRE